MNDNSYIDKIATRIYQVAEPESPSWEYLPLYRYYALLALAKGIKVSREDVHDAWSAWASEHHPGHRSLIPYYDLAKEVQLLDQPYVVAIRKVVKEFG